MSSIQTSIQLQDRMSQQLHVISSSVYDVVDSMHDVEYASGNMFDTSSIINTNSQLDATKGKIDAIENNIREADSQQDKFNQSLQESHSVADGLNSRLVQVAATIATAFGAGKVIGLSDEMTQTTARLNMMNDGLQTTEELQQMIFQSAQDSRGAYQTTADAVSKLGLNAGDAFNSTAEIVDFAEQLNKQFVIAGTETSAMEGAMTQLVQALGSGALRGDELNSIFEAAPTIIQTIADYMGKPIGQIKDLASEGLITADIVKNAMLSATDETNAIFEQMPMTWAQVGTSIQNQALMAFQPILNKINEIANSTRFQEFSANVVGAISNIASALSEVFDIGIFIINGIVDNWSLIEPIMVGVIGAFVAYKAILIVSSIAQGIATAAMTLYQIACALGFLAVGNLTAAQAALNGTMLANPIVFIAALIIGVLLVALYKWMKSCASLEVAWLKAQDTILFAWDSLLIAGSILVNGLLTSFGLLKIGIMTIWYGILNGIDSICAGIAITIQDMVNMAIGSINSLINAVNDIPGVFIEPIDEVSFGADAAVEAEARKQARQDELDKIIDDEYDAYSNRDSEIQQKADEAVRNSADRQAKIDEATAKAKAKDEKAKTNTSGSDYDLSGTQAGKDIGDTAANTAEVAKSVSDSTEELKYLRDVAEREVINRFTTAEIKVDMGGINNNINSNVDLDGIVTYLEDTLNETLASTAEQYNY
ncbi:tape measure protein [Anaerosporobacter sp.]